MDSEYKMFKAFAGLFGEMVYGIGIDVNTDDDSLTQAICYRLGEQVAIMLTKGEITLRQALKLNDMLGAYVCDIELDDTRELDDGYEAWYDRHHKKNMDTEKEDDNKAC